MSISHSELLSLLHYDPETGIWTRRVFRGGHFPGVIVGSPTSSGYLCTNINGKLYQLHILAWFYVTGQWPESELDHRDTIRNNNRWKNLRLATHAQNQGNRCLQKNNTSGFKGVTRHPNNRKNRKWIARIRENNKGRLLGVFDCPAAASFAYQIAADIHFGEFARAR